MIETLDGKVAVVTGGGGGLGRALGARFAREGMRVVLADVRAPALDATVAELADAGLDVAGVVTDVASWESVAALRDRVLEAHGRVHLVCNNAGIGAGAEGRVWEHELNDWRWAMAVNVYGVIHGINAFVPVMLEHGEPGHVVNTSSGNGGIAPILATPQYSVTKAAVVTLTESRFDPVVDLPVRGGVEITLCERHSVERAEIHSRVPGELLRPYVHQRYDNLSPVGEE